MKNLFPCFVLLFVLIGSSFTLSTPEAALPAHVDYYLKLEGVDGESTALGHEKWIELQSITVDKAAKTIKIVRKKTARSSPMLQLACAQGDHFKTAVLHQRKAGEEQHEYLTITLKDVFVTSYQTSGSDARPTEILTLGYTKATFNY